MNSDKKRELLQVLLLRNSVAVVAADALVAVDVAARNS